MGIKCSKHQLKRTKHAKAKSSNTVKPNDSKSETETISECPGFSTSQDVQNASHEYSHAQDEANQNDECVHEIYENTRDPRYQNELQTKESKFQPNRQKTKANKDLTDSYGGLQIRANSPKSDETAEHLYVNEPKGGLKTKMNAKQIYENTKQADKYGQDVTTDYVSLSKVYENRHPNDKYESLHNNAACQIYDSAQSFNVFNYEREGNDYQLLGATRGGSKQLSIFKMKVKPTFPTSIFRCQSSDSNFEKQRSRLDNIREQGTSVPFRYRPAPPPPDALE